MSPISLRLDVTEVEGLELSGGDLSDGSRDLSGDEGSSSSRGLCEIGDQDEAEDQLRSSQRSTEKSTEDEPWLKS